MLSAFIWSFAHPSERLFRGSMDIVRSATTKVERVSRLPRTSRDSSKWDRHSSGVSRSFVWGVQSIYSGREIFFSHEIKDTSLTLRALTRLFYDHQTVQNGPPLYTASNTILQSYNASSRGGGSLPKGNFKFRVVAYG